LEILNPGAGGDARRYRKRSGDIKREFNRSRAFDNADYVGAANTVMD
jgi:hypothetical protein